jgi:hypothetical protein
MGWKEEKENPGRMGRRELHHNTPINNIKT